MAIASDGLSVRMDSTAQDGYPYDSDMVFPLPRPLLREEKPFVKLWLWIPPDLPTEPNAYGAFQYFGFRVTITDQYNRFVWPGIICGRLNGEPWFFSRVLVDTPIAPASSGWWTLVLGWRDDGVMEFYVSPGRVESPAKVAQDDYQFPTFMRSLNGHFIDLRMTPSAAISPDFILNRLETTAMLPLPMLLPLREPFAVTLVGGYPSEPYPLEYSSDLSAWSPAGVIRDGESRVAGDGFFRLRLPSPE